MNKIFFQLLFIFLILSTTVIAQIKAKKAEDFIDSIGVAVHLDRNAGPYSNAANVKSQIFNLGIRHLRDQIRETSFTNYAMVKDLADNGIKMTGFMQGDFDNPYMTPRWWLQQINNNKAMYAYEAFEGPNESDLGMGFKYKGQTWPSGTKLFQQELFNTVKNDPLIKDRPVLGPTIGSGSKTSFANAMGNISSYVDHGNFHYYKTLGQSFSEGYPGWDLQSILDIHKVMFGNKPFVATEGSYSSSVNSEPGVSETLNSKYTLRYFLEYWRLGVVRTFKYELFDEGITDTNIEHKFGLIANDGNTVKLSGMAVKNLISLLKDPEPSKVFTPSTLNFSITNANSYTHYILLQKSTGKFYFVIWNDAPSWNDDLKKEINNNDLLTLTFNQTVLEAKLFAPCTDGLVAISTIVNPSVLNIVIPNHPYIYEISTPGVITNISETRNINDF